MCSQTEPTHAEEQLWAVHFFLALPFHLRFPNLYTYTEYTEPIKGFPNFTLLPAESLAEYAEPEHHIVSFRIHHETEAFDDRQHRAAADLMYRIVSHASGIPHGRPLRDEAEDEPTRSFSIIEFIASSTGECDTTALTKAFDSCLECVNTYLQAYRVETRHLVPRITRETCSFAVPMAVEYVAPEHRWTTSAFWLNENYDVFGHLPPLNEQNRERIAHFHFDLVRRHPLMVAREAYDTAAFALYKQGDYSAAVLSSAIAAETYLDSVLMLLLWEEGRPPRQAADLWSVELTHRVRRDYSARLGGTWQTSGNGAVATWSDSVHKVRHRIVHIGYRPTLDEAKVALKVVYGLWEFVTSRLVARRTTYPRSAMLIVGRDQLEAGGWFNGQLERFVEEQAAIEPDWVAAFNQWRDVLGNALGYAP